MKDMQSGDKVRIIEGRYRGQEGIVFLPLITGAEVIVNRKRHWFCRGELEQIIEVEAR